MERNAAIDQALDKLFDKYAVLGQDTLSYLEGLLYARSLTYWDYIHLDTLLSLQTPRTDYPDEQIFICYHQITELYFKLVLLELEQLLPLRSGFDADWSIRFGRIQNYFKALSQSFEVMTFGMDPQQFMRFRMSLLPASGFQSVQFREIEIRLTGLRNLTAPAFRPQMTDQTSPEEMYSNIYWKFGNLEAKSGKKTLTLRMFEDQYDDHLEDLAARWAGRNLEARWQQMPEADRMQPAWTDALKKIDLFVNVYWRLSHFKAAARYLHRDPDVVAATGGTNWQKYLPPQFQRIVFFPEIWSEAELAEWGKAWVLELFGRDVEQRWQNPAHK